MTLLSSFEKSKKIFLIRKWPKKDKSSPLSIAELLEVYVDGCESSYLYKKRQEYFNNLEVEGIKVGTGYYPDTNQSNLDLCIEKKYTDKQLEALASFLETEILPILKPSANHRYDNSMGVSKKMGIFEHTLSQSGVYSFIVDDKYKIVKTTYSIDRDVFESQSLIDVLKYIRKNLWY